MKQILNRPLLLAVVLSVPLWIVLGNYVVAILAALLIAFLLSMINTLRVLRTTKTRSQAGNEERDPE